MTIYIKNEIDLKRGYKTMDWKEDVKEMVYQGRIKVPYTWTVGEVGSRFFIELRDKKKIWGDKCPRCGTVFVPPRKVCSKCYSNIGEWVEVGTKGTLLTFTVVRYKNNLQSRDAPFAYGIIKLDGADTGLLHLLGEVDLEQINIGMRVEAVFGEDRKGEILDIKYFRPLKEA